MAAVAAWPAVEVEAGVVVVVEAKVAVAARPAVEVAVEEVEGLKSRSR